MVWIQFLISAAIVALAAHKLAEYGDIIAVRTRLGGLFVGTFFWQRPPLCRKCWPPSALFRAAGNLFCSSVFNVPALGVADFLYVDGRLLGTLARVERRIFFIELDSAACICWGCICCLCGGLGCRRP